MPITNTVLRPTKGFNQSFKEIVNCKIVPPPYNDKMQDMYFFLRKRDGITADYTSLDTYEDMEVYYDELTNTKEYHVLHSDRDSIYVPWTWVTWTSWSVVWDYKRYAKCKIPWWTIDSTGTISATGVVSVDVNYEPVNTLYIEKTAGVFNIWMVGKRVMLWDWWYWQGRYWEIVQVDVWLGRIYIEWISIVPDVWVDFTIYDWLVQALFTGSLVGVMCYNEWPTGSWRVLNTTTLDSVLNHRGVKGMTVRKTKLWFTDWDRVYYSFDSKYTAFSVTRYIDIADPWIMKLQPFWDYLLVFTKSKTYGIREQNLESWDKLYLIDELMWNLTLFNSESVLFDKTLYFFGNDKRFYSLNIIRSGNSDNIWEPVDQWMAIQNYLTGIADWADVLIFKDTDSLRILYQDNYELVYNYKWEWRMRNEYGVHIKNKKIFYGEEWIMWWLFIGKQMEWATQDVGDYYYQRIYQILDADDVFQIKQRKHYKFLMWKYNLPQTWQLRLIRQVNNQKQTKSNDLTNCSYIQELTAAIAWWTLDDVADVGLWTVAVDSWWILTEIYMYDLTGNWFMYGWVLVQKNTMNPKNNNIYNVS